jgi:DNA (cytosine-5)-methyltransferase 1
VTELIKGPARWFKGLLQRAAGRGEFVVDMFAGGGGTSKGIEAALGAAVDIAINHDPHAIAIHKANHPNTYHFLTDVREVDPRKVLPGRPVGLLWLSPDCTHHSRAKGGKPVKRNRRALANVGIVWVQTRRPRVIILENVTEFEGWGPLRADGLPDKSKAGQSFKRYVAKLRRLGYQVEWKHLVAADYGAPTIRKRLFLIARRDGRPIVWPHKTHAPLDLYQMLGLKPWRSAAECIDWDLPARSIFDRKKPLAEATLRRIHAGVVRYVLGGDPFIVTPGHQGDGFRGQGVDQPMKTITASRDFGAVVTPFLSPYYNPNSEGNVRAHDLRKPAPTIPSRNNQHALVEAFLLGAGGPAQSGKPRSKKDPLGTVLGQNHRAVALAFLNKHYTGVVGSALPDPLGTVTAQDHHSLTTAHLVHARGESTARDPREPLPTQTAKPHDALVAAHLTTLRGTSKAGRDARQPMPGITAGGTHVGEVRAFLVKYFRTGVPQSMRKPAPTLTAKQRLGLVEVHGTTYQIQDIRLRMLTPTELLRAQFGRHAEGYVLLGSQEKQIKAIGNSVPPEVAEALVRANYRADEAAVEVAA